MPRLGDDRLAVLAAAGDARAFETIYDRHHRALLGFCRHMLGTLEEAEDALQQTFLRAHRALAARGAPVELRPWLYTIARNCCLTMLSARRPVVDDERELAGSTEGLGEQVQARADLREVVADVERLPEDQRSALVLAELADLSHEQIAEVIGVRTPKVKALIHQARTTLIAEREARETPCEEIREQLATARGGALRRGPLRRHLRLCVGCQAYRTAVGEQRRALALVLPVTPSLGLKASVLGAASAGGGAGAAAVGGVASLGGGLAAKVVAGAIVVGGTTAGGIAVVDPPRPTPARAPAPANAPTAAPTASAVAGSSPVVVTRGVSRPATIGSPSRRASEPGATRQPSGPWSPVPSPGQAVAERSPGTGQQPAAQPEQDSTTTAPRQPAEKAKGRPAAGGPPGLAKKPAARITPPRATPPRANPQRGTPPRANPPRATPPRSSRPAEVKANENARPHSTAPVAPVPTVTPPVPTVAADPPDKLKP
jgi:RNA polymerase sigma factor (sigma-70 family)